LGGRGGAIDSRRPLTQGGVAALAHIAQDARHRVGRRQPCAKDALDAIQHARRHLLVFPGHTPQDRLSRFRRLVDLDERHGVLLET